MSSPRVAIVYDWADTHYGGAEQVLTALHQLYPQAPLFTSFATPAADWTRQFPAVYTSFLQRWPQWLRRHKALLAVFLPLAFARFDLRDYDLVISVTSFAAKGVHTHHQQRHICYLLTPTRFLFSHADTYFSWWTPLIWPVKKLLQRWDIRAAQRPDHIIAISRLVAARCQQYYGRQVDDIIYPTLINLPQVTHASKTPQSPFFLCVGRLVPYKKIDLVVKVCGELRLPLVVIGAGPQLAALQKLAARQHWSHLIFLQNQPAKTLKMYYNTATALIAPGLEDFGINLLEANAQGTLVVTHPQSGSRELLDASQACDLEPDRLEDSLRQLLQSLSQQPKKIVHRQTLDYQHFLASWTQKVNAYEQH